MRWRFGWLQVVSVPLAVVGVLAGCTSGGGQNLHSAPPTGTVPARSASPTLTPSRTGPLTTGPNVAPGETPPTLSPIAKQHTSTGAHAFAVYYIQALDWSQATSDPFLLRAISAPNCTTCATDIASLARLHAEGGYLRSGRTRIDSAITVFGKGEVKADYTIKFELTQDPVVIVRPTSTRTVTDKPQNYVSYVYVSWIRDKWMIIEITGTA